MNIDTLTKNIDMTDAIRAYIEEKMASLEKILTDIEPVSLRVEVGKPSQHHRSGEVFYAEANLKAGKLELRAEATREDLYVAINEVKEDLQLQISKIKEKEISNRRQALEE